MNKKGEVMRNIEKAKKELVIVTPVYNTERYIDDFLKSVLSQNFDDFDIYLVDDGSTDGSYKKVKQYVENDQRVHVLKKENGGASSARNFALDYITNKRCDYKYIYFCDSDDIVGDNALLEIMRALKADEKVDYAIFSVAYLYKTGIVAVSSDERTSYRISDKDIIAQYFRWGRKWRKHSTTEGFLNNKIFNYKKVNKYRFDISLKRAEDFDFFVSVLPELKTGVVVPSAWYFYRKRKSSLTSTIKETGDLEVFLKHKDKIDNRSVIEKRCLQHKFLRAIYTGVCRSILCGDEGRAKELLRIKKITSLRYSLSISDVKMLMILKMPFDLIRYFVKVRQVQDFGKDKKSYFD